MDEIIVVVLTTIAIIFVICGFINRKRHRERDEANRTGNIPSRDLMDDAGSADATFGD
ncbi:MAG: hypothetical protein ABFD97_25880 [Syntrophobacter sp.]